MSTRATSEQLIQVIRLAARDGTRPAVAEAVPNDGHSTGAAGLSGRADQAVLMMAMGYSNKQVAARLRGGVKTVETFKARSMEKLGIRNRIDLVRHDLRHGWLEDLLNDQPPASVKTPGGRHGGQDMFQE
ncbi:response regulator transcription factor [Zavarzinella formosa]|uniref:response regulator transcription factor n=1 Tax=Zavarzinella formosa TaxID=360055 RepID=UPI0002FEAFEE|nr:LuxR C-terminal-related transcriptional regulator [Zavarzinella formosa]